MPRIARKVEIGLPHHITQRGNNRQDVFVDDKDRVNYLYWLERYSKEYSARIISCCLMSNHIHLIAVPEHHDSFSKTLSCTHYRYTQYFNRKMGLSGHLWQGRFYSCPLKQGYLETAIKYVELNPVSAGLVDNVNSWRWTSGNQETILTKLITLEDKFKYIALSKEQWKKYFTEHFKDEEVETIRKSTIRGRF
ncbi:MAG: hypothetical protein A2231_04380 [Candidatus Firestonebacteria bacterium RIFOXYA2_FULL_40_8]|nr:MAG: hypothetical protein A2231_04380 [Candidatus Firestonebacteria bacterium RIFOXYA2_FULL_40_8]